MTFDFDDPLPASTPRAPAEGPAFPFGQSVAAADSRTALAPAPVPAVQAATGGIATVFERSGFRPPDATAAPAPPAGSVAGVVAGQPPHLGLAAQVERAQGAGARPGSLGPDLPSVLLFTLQRAINHVLRQQGWARERLRPFAGRIVLLAVDPASPFHRLAPPLRTRITADGLLEVGGPGTVAAADGVSLWLRPGPAMVFDGLAAGPRGLSAHLRVDGDVMLAAVVGDLARHLRWDAEDDVSRVVGDVAARRLFSSLARLRERLGRTRSNLEMSAVQYLTVEDPQLLSGAGLAAHAARLVALQQRLDQLDRRFGKGATRP